MSKEENDGNIVIQGDVGETAQLQEEEERLAKKQAREDVEVAEGQELEVLPKNEEEEKQDILLTEAISTTLKKSQSSKNEIFRNQSI